MRLALFILLDIPTRFAFRAFSAAAALFPVTHGDF